MKHKKLVVLLSFLLGASMLTACTQANQKVSLKAYWRENLNDTYSFTEETVYSVTHSLTSSLNAGYGLEYSDGEYTTTLSYENGEYTYTTELTINVTYTFNGATKTAQDTTVSTTKFAEASNALRPISSSKTVKSHSPQTGTITSLENCYKRYESVSNISYNEDGTGSYTLDVTTYSGETPSTQKTEKSFEIDTKKYNYLDNEQLAVALRGIDPTSTTNPKFLVFSPFANAAQPVKNTFSSATTEEFSFLKNGETFKDKISYRPVETQLDVKMSGSAKTIWIATTTDAHDNEHRNVILKMDLPLPYSLGSLVYKLTSVTYTEKQ